MFSNTELFPLDCPPTTAICGRSISFPPIRQHNARTSTNNREDFLDIVDNGNQSLHSKIRLSGIHCWISKDIPYEAIRIRGAQEREGVKH